MTPQRRNYDKPSIVFYAVAACVVAVWFRIGWVLWYPYKPLIVHGPQKILNEGKKVAAGGMVVLESHFTKNTAATAQVSRQFVNKFVYYVTPYTATLPPSKSKTIQVEVPVPIHAVPGPCRLYTTYTYRVSDFPEKDVTVPAWSEWFEIVPPDGGDK